MKNKDDVLLMLAQNRPPNDYPGIPDDIKDVALIEVLLDLRDVAEKVSKTLAGIYDCLAHKN